MKYLKSLYISLLLLTVSFQLSLAVPADTVRILAIGNSFSQDAVEQYLFELAEADGIPVVIGNAYIPGCSIERHLNNLKSGSPEYSYRKTGADGIRRVTDKVDIAFIIADEDWDYVSFQQASPLSGVYETYEKSLPELYEAVRAALPEKTEIILHQTWAYQTGSSHSGFKKYGCDQMTMYRAIVDANRKASKLLGIRTVVPSGTAIQNARTSFIGDNFTRDGYHLDLLWGRYTAACAWYETIFGKVLGNDYAPDGLTADYRQVAQLAAREAVRHPDRVTAITGVKELPVIYRDASASIEERTEDLLSRMTLSEKIYQLNQYVIGRNDNVNNIGETVKKVPGEIGSLIYFGDDASLRNAMQKRAMETRLGIPILFGFDVIHGFRTVYPIPLAQAASWNPDLAGDACRVAAAEAYSTGINWTFSPMVDIARDPRWGRIAEGYGEDPHLCSAFSAATVKAYQGDDLSAENNIAACLKHFVGYGASEAGRDYVPTEISRQTLWDTYFPSFEAGVKAGAVTLMSSFNNISGIPGSANRYTMTEVLKNRWNHQGFIVADWNAVEQLINQGMAADRKEAACLAFNAGLDMDMVDNIYQTHLATLVKEGAVSRERLDDAVRRVLRVKFKLGLFEKPYTDEKPDGERLLRPEYLAVAEQIAQESIVLLKNENNILPLKNCREIAVIGPLAKNRKDMLGSWYGRGREEDVVSIFDGLSAALGKNTVLTCAAGCDFDGTDTSAFAEAVAAAEKADLVVLCLGEKRNWSGENASRSTIALPEIQEQLLAAISRTGKNVVLLLSNGRPLDLARMEPMADAIVEIWQPGVTAGNAVAGILSGKYNPSGKLPVTFPYATGQIPIYYNRRNSGRTGSQGRYQDIPSTPKYEFGYGLSYSEFKYGPLSVSSTSFGEGDKVRASVTVTNTSGVDGKETVQWYICDPYSRITRPVKELRHFEKRMVKAGESEVFTFEIDPLTDLGFVDEEGRKYLEKGDYYIMVGPDKVKITVK